ncbi:MAG: damage-control phosphatase ARMT1 family protein [Anaerolineales bacterium]
MNHRPYCIPCCLRRTLHTAETATADEWLHRKILGEIMAEVSRVEAEATPAEVIHRVFRKTARTLGMADPYAAEKRRFREEVLANEAWIRERVDGSPDPFFTALKLAVAANKLDNELRPLLTLKGLVEGLDEARFEPECYDGFRAAAAKAGKLLYIHDSAGELFFDRLLIEKLGRPRAAVTSVVRQLPVIADATREDAEAVGIPLVAGEVTDPGADCLGVPLRDASEEFRARFAAADLVVVKGQAGYQTLEREELAREGTEKDIFYLLSVKCPVMAGHLGVELGELVLEHG